MTHIKNKMVALLMTMLLTMSLSVFPAFAGTATVSVLDGKIGVTGTITGTGGLGFSSGSTTVSGNVVTATAIGGATQRETNAISITNNIGKAATITFNYSASNYNKFSENTTSGAKSVELAAGETKEVMTIEGKRALSSNTAKLILSDFSYTVAADTSVVKFNFTGGTVTVDGTGISTGATVDISSGTGSAIVATPASGYSFLGWVNESTGAIISTSASYTLAPVGDMTVKAAFASASSNAWFLVPAGTDSFMYDDLNQAGTKASSCDKKVILAANGTITSGNYAIPAGVTLLIPRDAANTIDTTEPKTTKPTDFGTTPPAPTSFRKLTMANGANLAVNGSLNIGGTQWAGGKYVSATGDSGFIQMNSGSSITVNSGGSLHAWGYITGSGSVTAKSGATVYEQFQVGGWRGGDMTSTMIGNSQGVFPMSQYYVQNIEVPLTLESGATEIAFASASISVIGIQPISVDFVGAKGSGSMFEISSGYVTKDYVENEDRLKIEVHGDVSLTPIEIDMKLGILGSANLKSKDYDLPLNHNMIIHGVSGTMTINQDVALLPGTQVIIDEGVTCTLGEGVGMYAYDVDEWGAYCGSVNQTIIPVAHAPGRTATRTAAGLTDASICINGTVDASKGYLYTTAGKANVYSDGGGVVKTKAGSQTVTYQVKQASEASDSTYPEIPITPAKLKNANGTYVQSGTNAYTYVDGKWMPASGFEVLADGIYYPYAEIDKAISDAQDKSDKVYAYGTPTISGTLDLRGCDIVACNGAAFTLADGANIIDTETDAYLTNTGDRAGSIAGVYTGVYKNAATGRSYLAISLDGKTTQFHRVAVAVTAVRFGLRGTQAQMDMECVFRGTAEGLKALTDVGFRITNYDTGANDEVIVASDEQTFVVDGGQQMTTINSNYTNGASTIPVYYTTDIEMDTDVEAMMDFGGIKGYGYKHTAILSDVLAQVLEQMDGMAEKPAEYERIKNFVEHGDTAGEAGEEEAS